MVSRVYQLLDTLDLTEGQSLRINCPDCNDDNSSLGLKVENGTYVWNCFRVSCNSSGASFQGMTASEIRKAFNKNNDDRLWQEDTCHELDLMDVPSYVVSNKGDNKLLNGFISYWGLEGVDIRYDVRDKRAVFPIYEGSRLIDAVGRALDGSIPKWFKYTGGAKVYMTSPAKPNGVAVIVEDVISANTICSMCPNVTGVAILGTTMSVKHMEYLEDFTRIIVALDRDASVKTLTYKREIASWLGIDTIAMLLQDDIKYKKPDDKELLTALCG